MKKYIYKISVLLFTLAIAIPSAYAQEDQNGSLRDRLAKRKAQEEKKDSSIPQLSVRAEKMNQNQTRDLTNATWVREVYRMLDLEKGSNAALMYPVEPIGDRMNLFTMIFKLMAQGDLTAYEYYDGREMFTDGYKTNFQDVLERLEIPFEKNGDTYAINEMDIPSNEALTYYVKEAWYFDESNSVLDVKILAICPLLRRMEYFDSYGSSGSSSTDVSDESYGDVDPEGYPEENIADEPSVTSRGGGVASSGRTPLFWIPYENIRPYAARMPIMTSNINNAMRKTVDDYFRLRLYEGEIFKTTNMENKVLPQMYDNEADIKKAQKRIENELESFEENLWIINDSIKTENVEYRKEKAKKQKPPKRSKSIESSSQPSFSARDRR